MRHRKDGELGCRHTAESRAEHRPDSHNHLTLPYHGSQTDPQYGHYIKLGVPETEVAIYPKMNTGLVSLATRARANL